MASTEPAVSVPRRENMTATSGMCQRLHPARKFFSTRKRKEKKSQQSLALRQPQKTNNSYASGKQYLD
jgi:hypothetical protein